MADFHHQRVSPKVRELNLWTDVRLLMFDDILLYVRLWPTRSWTVLPLVFLYKLYGVPTCSLLKLGRCWSTTNEEDLPRCAAAAVLLWWKCVNVVFQKCTEAFTCQTIGTPKLPCNGEGRKSWMETGGTKRQMPVDLWIARWGWVGSVELYKKNMKWWWYCCSNYFHWNIKELQHSKHYKSKSMVLPRFKLVV